MKNKNYKLLSYFLDKNTPLYRKTKSILIKPDHEIKKGYSCNTAMIAFSNHSGTQSAFQKREEGREAHKVLLKSNGSYGQPICIIEDMDLSKNLKN